MSVSFRQVWTKLCFRKRAIKMLLSNERPIIALGGTVNVQGDASGRSKLIVQTLNYFSNDISLLGSVLSFENYWWAGGGVHHLHQYSAKV